MAAWHLASQINREGWRSAEVDFRNAEGLWIRTKAHELLDTHAFEPSWEPIFIFLTGILKRPAEFFAMLSDSRKDDHFRHRLSLYCRCYGMLSADKEAVLTHTMEQVLTVVAIEGRKAARLRPDRWRRWLGDISSLMCLPVAGKRIAARLLLMGSKEHEMRMHNFGHDLVELLAKTSRGLHWQTSMEALIVFCTEILGQYYEIADAARQIVEIEESRGGTEYIQRLAMLVSEPTQKPWRQIPVAGALLRATRDKIVEQALNFLLRMAEDNNNESWIRSQAKGALTEGLCGLRENEVAALILDQLLASSTSRELRMDIVHEILRSAKRCTSDTLKGLMMVVCVLSKYDADLTGSCAEIFSRWKDQVGVSRAITQLWFIAKSTEIDCYPRIKALQEIIAYAHREERSEAIAILKEFSAQSTGDGRKEYLAIDALLQAGEPYSGTVRERLLALVSGPRVESNWIVRGCELASDFADQELIQELMPRLLLIWSGKKPTESDREPDYGEKHSVAELLRGTCHWPELQKWAFEVLHSPEEKDRENWQAVETVAFSAASSSLLKLTEDLLAIGKRSFRPWHILLRELGLRGWRLQVRIDRTFRVLRYGQEEPRVDAHLGW